MIHVLSIEQDKEEPGKLLVKRKRWPLLFTIDILVSRRSGLFSASLTSSNAQVKEPGSVIPLVLTPFFVTKDRHERGQQ